MASVAGPQHMGLESSRSGVRFGKYRLMRELAQGGMAKIYLAAIDGPGGFSKTCVVKRILPEHSQTEEFSRMFVTEARVAALLNHANIVQVFDFGQVGKEYYIAMEWVDGASLETLMQRSFQQNVVPGVRVATRVAMALADALHYAHAAKLPDGPELNLVHRDLTPGNVLIAHNGTVKLTDFGVAKASLSHDRTTAGVVKGKFAYMAPEQVRGDQLDRRTDLFALGIIMYELASGKWLFRRPQLAEVINAVSTGNVPPLSKVAPATPKEFEAIVMKVLAPKPDDRYPNGKALLADLEAFQNTQQWTSSSRELTALMQSMLPPPDPTRMDPQPISYQSPPSQPSHRSQPSMPPPPPAEIQVDADDLLEEPLEASIVESSSSPVGRFWQRQPWWTWALVGLGVMATAALWVLLLS